MFEMIAQAHTDAIEAVHSMEGSKFERIICAAFIYIGILVLSLTVALVNKAVEVGYKLVGMVEDAL